MKKISAFLADDRGSQAIEFVLWLPILGGLLFLVVQATSLYITHAEMWNVARDTARRLTTGYFGTTAQAEAYAVSQIGMRDFPYQVTATYDPNTSAEVTIVLGYAPSGYSGGYTGYVPNTGYQGLSPLLLIGGNLTARVAMRADSRIALSGGGTSGGGNGGGNGGGTTGGGTTGGGTTGGGTTGGGTSGGGNGGGNGGGKPPK